ncbi:adenylate kinase [Phycicoccus sp.]|uniref:adenylate kinase n=1 Tax=Phycicoccus sp. TaxID=1902410 RepID=UPI002D15A4CE|nr:adenylate kinase [Phycicoccus sp.]HMM93723.1 adenylate kinase [Phycicoccus sp.]
MLLDGPFDLARHRRVVILGVTGSGKSSLAVRLAAVGGLPYVAVDDLMWRPGWVQLDAAGQVEAVRPHAEGPTWVMDAVWSATRELVLGRTDLVIALDYPRRVSLGRLLNRTLRRLRDHEEVCGGNTESWRQTLSRDSIVAWHVRSYRRKHAQIETMCATPDGPPVLRFTDPRQTESWLRSLEHAAAA